MFLKLSFTITEDETDFAAHHNVVALKFDVIIV